MSLLSMLTSGIGETSMVVLSESLSLSLSLPTCTQFVSQLRICFLVFAWSLVLALTVIQPSSLPWRSTFRRPQDPTHLTGGRYHHEISVQDIHFYGYLHLVVVYIHIQHFCSKFTA